MRTLIVEDDFTCRRILQLLLAPYGECDIAVDGLEAVDAYQLAVNEKKPYDLVCMDIMMPNMNGQEALKKIKEIEFDMSLSTGERAKVIMVTALDDPKSIMGAFKEQCEAYLVKPIKSDKLIAMLKDLELIEAT
ncbi:response regulator [Thermodesulfobacteriota bacterium]